MAKPAQRAVKFVSSAAEASATISALVRSLEQQSKSSNSYGGSSSSDGDNVRLDDVVAFDVEGSALGRFGKVCLLQVATQRQIILADALKSGVVEAFRPLLEHPHLTKIMHDCREDSAALTHQHGITLRGIYDCQAAHVEVLRARSESIFLTSLTDLLSAHDLLSAEDEALVRDAKAAMAGDPLVWVRRPLTAPTVRYALSGVTLLLPLFERLKCQVPCHAAVLAASRHNVDYAQLNTTYHLAKDVAKYNNRVQALLTSRSEQRLFFKLNCGRPGVVTTASALHRLREFEVGDVVDCVVAGLSTDARHVFLDKYDHDVDFHDKAKTGGWSNDQKKRHRQFVSSALVGGEEELQLDPLLQSDDDEGADLD